MRCHNSWVEFNKEYISYGYCPPGNQFVWSEDIPRRYWKQQEDL